MTFSVFDSAVIMMKGVCESSGLARTSLSKSYPVIGSMFQSEITRPYFLPCILASAAEPSLASSTFSKPICLSRLRMMRIMVLESSTTRIGIDKSKAMSLLREVQLAEHGPDIHSVRKSSTHVRTCAGQHRDTF